MGEALFAAGRFIWAHRAIAAGALAAIVIGILTILLHNANRALDNEASFRTEVATTLGLHGNGQSGIRLRVTQVVAESADRLAHLQSITQEADAAKARADAADARLHEEQDANARQYAAAQRRITDLQTRRPTGNAQQDMAQIESDSQAAWRDWR